MGGLVSSVGGLVGAGANLLGGSKGGTTNKSGSSNTDQTGTRTIGDEGAAAKAAQGFATEQFGQGGFGDQLTAQYGKDAQATAQLNDMFRNALLSFSTGTLNPTPQQLQQATQFVDETFTKPAETQYGRFVAQAADQSSMRAAASGRSSLDPAYQREFAAQTGQAAQDLSNQRGSLIAQQAQNLAVQQPQMQLNALLQGSQYFNNSLQQAANNRLNLLNAATNQQNTGLTRGQATGGYSMNTTGQTQDSETKPGAGMGSLLGGFIEAAAPIAGFALGGPVGGTIGGAVEPSLGNFAGQLGAGSAPSTSQTSLYNNIAGGKSAFGSSFGN